MSIDYITLPDVLAIHSDQLARFGGGDGVRDAGLLESALFRPQTGYYAGLVEQAAALWESLAQNHPFIDGNKRTAFAGTFAFLAINGLEIEADPREAYGFISGLYEARNFRFDPLVGWLREHTRPVKA